jgi:hypothetical protein
MAKNDSIDPDHTENLKFGLTTKVIEILCPNGEIESINEIDEPLLMFTLEVQKTIDQGDITTLLNGIGGPLTTADLKACVADTALLAGSILDPICGGDPPTAVLIREMKAQIETSWCKVLNPLKCGTVSTHVDDDCTLPNYSNLNNYPKNLNKGADYDCKGKP